MADQFPSHYVVQVHVGTTLVIRLNRPEEHNALNMAMYAGLAEALVRAQNNDEIRAIVITGGDHCFTSGDDLNDLLASPPKDTNAPVFQFMSAVLALQKPLIASVSGVAIGTGVTLLAHCDLVFITQDSMLSLPFIKLGMCQNFGASVLMPMILGPQRTFRVLVSGETFTGAEAAGWGLATEALPSGPACLEAAIKTATYMGGLPESALQSSKALLRAGIPNLVEIIHRENELMVRYLATEVAIKTIRRFVESA